MRGRLAALLIRTDENTRPAPLPGGSQKVQNKPNLAAGQTK
jgi:hypothetical protein